MSLYQEKLNAICADIESMPGTGGARALRIEFKRTGRRESFNAIHATARARVSGDQDE